MDRLAADGVLLLHLGFILFAVLGAALSLWRRWIAAVHVPAAAWAVFVELTGRVCPLTALENTLRLQANQAGYAAGFIEHHLLGLIYPAGLTRDIQFALAAAVVLINLVLYAWVVVRWSRARVAQA